MVKSFTLLVAVVIGIALVSYMFVYQVRYDEVAVVTTFDRATAQSVVREPGAHLCLPWPVQRVYTYSRLIQVLEPQQEQIALGGGPTFQLHDGGSVVVRYYMAWRIDDSNPFEFYSSLQNTDEATKRLEPILRQEMAGTLGSYSFTQLVNTDPAKLKLPEIEETALQRVRDQIAGRHYGVKIEQVGIRRIVLPEGNVQAVYNSMSETRKTMAASAKANGEAVAQQIESDAEATKQRILAFADRVARDIKAQGQMEAAQNYKVFEQNEELAIQLLKIDAAIKAFGGNSGANVDIILESQQIGLGELTGSVTPGSVTPGSVTPGSVTPGSVPPGSARSPSAATRPASSALPPAIMGQ